MNKHTITYGITDPGTNEEYRRFRIVRLPYTSTYIVYDDNGEDVHHEYDPINGGEPSMDRCKDWIDDEIARRTCYYCTTGEDGPCSCI